MASGMARAKIVLMEGQETPPSWRYTGSNAGGGLVQDDPRANIGAVALVANEADSIQWTASEYMAHDKTVVWYMGLIGVTVVLALVTFLVSRSIFSTVVVVLISGVIAAYAARDPKTQTYRISGREVLFAGKRYSLNEFRSFALVRDGGVPSIWLIPLRRIMPPLIMYLEPKDEDKIVDLLSEYLPHEQRDYDLLERLMRYLHF